MQPSEDVRKYLSKIGKKRGQQRFERGGVEVMRAMGKKGGKTRAQRYDKATLSRWAKKGGRPRKEGK